MNKFDEEIVVVKRDVLFAEKYFNGYLSNTEYDFEKRINENYEYLRRGDAEENPEWQQPIPYAILVNKANKTVYDYQRASDIKKAGEKRLHGKWSLGIGGHVDREDGETSTNPIATSLLRELEEETGITSFKDSRLLGYINQDDNHVGKVHFGILHVIETNEDVIPQLAEEIAHGKFISINELRSFCESEDCDVEGWSMICLDPLENYFKKIW